MNSGLIKQSISTLAYIGDAYYELLIRKQLFLNMTSVLASGRLHNSSIAYVSAKAQANILHILSDHLTEFESNLVRRARNYQSHSLPKHADPVAYRYATAFEALLGYLYLDGQEDRVRQLLHLAIPDLF